MRKTVPKRRNFVSSNAKAKSEAIAKIVQIARKERLSYDDFLYICQQVRRKLGLRRPKRERKLPQLLGEADLKRSFRVIQDCGDVQHEILLKFLFFTAVRVSELVNIKVSDVDLGRCKVFIDQGKGTKDRYILFPASFRLVLKSHLQANPKKTDTCSRPVAVDPIHPRRHTRRPSRGSASNERTCLRSWLTISIRG
jgi:integrase/recombinase XerD